LRRTEHALARRQNAKDELELEKRGREGDGLVEVLIAGDEDDDGLNGLQERPDEHVHHEHLVDDCGEQEGSVREAKEGEEEKR
jgi:hypothetical protein